MKVRDVNLRKGRIAILAVVAACSLIVFLNNSRAGVGVVFIPITPMINERTEPVAGRSDNSASVKVSTESYVSRDPYLHQPSSSSAVQKMDSYQQRGATAVAFTTAVARAAALRKYSVSTALLRAPLSSLSGPSPTGAAALCELMLLGNEACKMSTEGESMDTCIVRLGPDALTAALQPQCSRSPFWLSATSRLRRDSDNSSSGYQKQGVTVGVSKYGPLRDRVVKAAVVTPQSYIPPNKRTVAKFGRPFKCSFGNVFPFGFLMPSSNFVPQVSRNKFLDWMPVTPNTRGSPPINRFPTRPLSFVDEYLSSLLYEHSYFSWTHWRGGFHCLRHLESMARGNIPLFPDFNFCEDGACLRGYPLDLFREAWTLPGLGHIHRNFEMSSAARREGRKFSNDYLYRFADMGPTRREESRVNFKGPAHIDWAAFDVDKYFDLADRLLNFTRHHLTASAGVAYLLEAVGLPEPKSVLFIDMEAYDYVGSMVECGLTELGINVTFLRSGDKRWVKNPAEQNMTGEGFVSSFDRGGYGRLQGDGFILSRRCDPGPNPDIALEAARAAINANAYDLIIFPHCGQGSGQPPIGCWGRRTRLLHEILAAMRRRVTKVAMLNIADYTVDVRDYSRFVQEGMFVFEREPIELVHPNGKHEVCIVQ